jgi:hypothetical protein
MNRVKNRESDIGCFAKWLAKMEKSSVLSQKLTNPLLKGL